MKIYHFGFEAHSGIRNMAVDEAMLEAVRWFDVPILRFYAWNEPTLSLGYFQRYEQRQSHPPSLGCPVVRRLTGGGAIVHDRELTYSLAVPPGHELAEEHRLHLYETIHRAVIGVLSDWGVDAFLASDVEALTWEKPDKETFLCFQRIASGDVVVRSDETGWVKLLGSAQYRDKHGAVLQHGSLLWERSTSAPELAGLREHQFDEPRTFQKFRTLFEVRLMGTLGERLDIRWQPFGEEERKEMESTIAILWKKRYVDSWVKKK